MSITNTKSTRAELMPAYQEVYRRFKSGQTVDQIYSAARRGEIKHPRGEVPPAQWRQLIANATAGFAPYQDHTTPPELSGGGEPTQMSSGLSVADVVLDIATSNIASRSKDVLIRLAAEHIGKGR